MSQTDASTLPDPAIVLSTYADVAAGFRSKELRQALYDEGGIIMADCLLDLHGAPHRERRRLENRLFRRSTFEWFESEVMGPTIDAVLDPAVEAGGGDLIELGYRAVMELTARIAGVDRSTGSVEESNELLNLVVTFGEGATLVHATGDRDQVRARVADSLNRFEEQFFGPSLRRRQALIAEVEAGRLSADELPRDVLTTLLSNQSELGLPRDVILREVAFYLQAGGHSTSNALTHALDDIFVWSAGRPDRVADLVSDPYRLQRAVHETLRLHPASPHAWRRALTSCRLSSGQEVAEGQLVVLDITTANRDPAVFGDDADSYNPARQLPASVSPWGHTFGGGMHACIGEELDGGLAGGPSEAAHLFGTVSRLAEAFLTRGARPDPDQPPTMTTASERPHFARYPVIFGA
jgi:cytochrome P450